MEVTTANQLLDRFLADQAPEKTTAKRFRSDYLKVVRAISSEGGEPIPAAELPVTKSQLVERIGGAVSAPAVSRYMRIIAWAIEQGHVELPGDPGATLGFPPFERREITPPWRHAQVVYGTVLRVATARGIRFEDATTDFWLEAFAAHLKSHRSGRVEVNNFLRVWRTEAKAGRVPEVKIPSLPSKRRTAYRLPESEWPETLKPGLVEIRRWLEESIVKGRAKKQKKRAVSVNQQINNLLRYGGYWANIVGEDISRLGWQDLFSAERVLKFICFTDPGASNKVNGHRFTTGVTQEAYFNTFIDTCRGPLRLPDCVRELENLKAQFLFETRRDPIPEHLTPNDFFGVANRLIEKAIQVAQVGHTIQAAVLRRDALLIVLTMLWPRRVDVWHRLRLDKHVKVGSPIRLCLWREESKPGKADEILEIPPEAEGLFRHYINVDRPHLMGGKCDEGPLFVAQGGKAVGADTPRVSFRNRIDSILGFEIGTHALRKIWTHRYLDYSGGDYLTVMLILDTSMGNIVNAYRDGQDKSAAREFVDTADRLAAELLRGGKHHEI